MGFKASNTIIGKADPTMGLPILTQEEIFHILQIVGESKFSGKEVEKIFQLTLKLQKMYLDLNKFKDKQLWIYTHQKTYH